MAMVMNCVDFTTVRMLVLSGKKPKYFSRHIDSTTVCHEAGPSPINGRR
jgi:hypothetical protein